MLSSRPNELSPRVIGPWALTGIVVNSVIGAGIFSLPKDTAAQLKEGAPWAHVLAILVMAPIAGVYALIGSRLRNNGGQYVYAKQMLGAIPGTAIAWYVLIVRGTSAAVIAATLVQYLGLLVPTVQGMAARVGIVVSVVALLTVINIHGIRDGTKVSSAFTLFKLGTLAAFVVAGLILLPKHHVPVAIRHGTQLENWTEALAILLFAYGGFDAVLCPAGEVESPRQSIPFALFVGLLAVGTTYFLVQLVVTWAVPNVENVQSPLANAAEAFAGKNAKKAMALVVVASTFGWLTAAFVTVPKVICAMAQQGDFFAFAAQKHRTFDTPHIAILCWAVLVCLLGVSYDPTWNLRLSVGARLLTYSIAALSLVRDRRQPLSQAGWLAVALALALCLWLMQRVQHEHGQILLGVFGLSVLWSFKDRVVRGRHA
jgi:basic amino acid/polyamine antiporter, APA family